MTSITESFLNHVNDPYQLLKFFMFNTRLRIANTPYRFLELEIYVCDRTHNDIYTHCHPCQKNSLTWYFHQMSHKEHSYKGGTFKGLDITCAKNEGYGGVLIRAIVNELTGEIIEGPCKVVNHILELLECENIKTLVTTKLSDLSVFSSPMFRLCEANFDDSIVYSGPRIGLKESEGEKKLWVFKDYRFVYDRSKIKKQKTKLTLRKEEKR